MIVVQHQQQALVRVETIGNLVEQAIQPLLEGERLVPLAHLQVPHGFVAQARIELAQAVQQAFEEAPRIAVAPAQAEPEAVPAVGQAFAEFDGQGAFAETGRCAEHQQAAFQAIGKTLAQPRARNMAGGTRRAKEACIRQGGGQHRGARTGQYGHHPASRNVVRAGAQTRMSLAVRENQ
ncbi:hypothetical protein D9M69_482960 [compost metagenome]